MDIASVQERLFVKESENKVDREKAWNVFLPLENNVV